MFRALVEHGRALEAKGVLPPTGYFTYADPIQWVIHLWPTSPTKIAISASDSVGFTRPYFGRSSNRAPHPVTDEAAYALGLDRKADGKTDPHANEKHELYVSFLEELIGTVGDEPLREALKHVRDTVKSGTVLAHPRAGDITAKEWVSFVLEEGPLAGRHLFDEPGVHTFWAKHIEREATRADSKISTCAICGRDRAILKKLPSKVKLNSNASLHSLNNGAFVSYRNGKEPTGDASLGICFECGDLATRAFNYMSSDNRESHLKTLVKGEGADGLDNQLALYWMTTDGPEIQAGDVTFDPVVAMPAFTFTFADPPRPEKGETAPAVDPGLPIPDLAQLRSLLQAPWAPKSASLTLDDTRFRLAILSPNVSRVVLREWVDVSLREFKNNLGSYLDAVTLPAWGRLQPVAIRTMLNALAPKKGKSNMKAVAMLTRGLMRTAYLGHRPPPTLLNAAVSRLHAPTTHEEPWRVHGAIAAAKLVLTHGTKEATLMHDLHYDITLDPPARLCGRLLAMAEKARQIAQRSRGSADEKSGRTLIVDRYYAGASTTPASIFANVLRLVETAYLPMARRSSKTVRSASWLERQMQETLVALSAKGGFPTTLTPEEQADFAIGFYLQRAKFFSPRKKDNDNPDKTLADSPAEDDTTTESEAAE